jgi:hypothetical protein
MSDLIATMTPTPAVEKAVIYSAIVLAIDDDPRRNLWFAPLALAATHH